ncbi:hypothetical protein GN244_ATG18834 [Phytophthora infestans]|uniref:Uncharacterized protein n=1 Tax=Phytophthora infestans TaxID=4787 RepID=A0A833SVZ4_PHYIN|nr:hypothetical protein GN244_ATG18834 [Phytophthora infestans]
MNPVPGLALFCMMTLTEGRVINYSAVAPFTQPDPVSIEDKRAIEFKPQIHIGGGAIPTQL